MPGSDIHASDQNTVLFQSTEWGQFEPLIAPLSARQASAVDEYTSPHDICNKCIVFRTFLQELNVSELQPDWKHEISHHATGISLESSARAGCHLCSLLWDSLADLNHSSGLTDSYEFRGLMIGRGGTQITLTIRKEKEDELQYLGIGESIDPSKDRLEVSAKLLWRGQHCFFAKPLRVYSLTGVCDTQVSLLFVNLTNRHQGSGIG